MTPLKPARRQTDATGMTREERLLAVIHAQSEIAAAALDRQALIALVAEWACEITGAQAAVVEVVGDTPVSTGAPSSGPTITVPLVSTGAPVGALTVYAGDSGRFEEDATEMLSMMSAIVAAQLLEPHDRGAQQRLGSGPFRERVSLECARWARDGGDFSVVMLDIEGLKSINDIHGIEAGDGVLRTLSAVLDRWTRAIDGVYRVGGGTFALVLPGASVETAAMLTERITAQMADAHPLHVPLSFGISGPGDDPTVVIRTADEALYRVKRERRERAAA
ncbi:MAG TPA: sensor domain-containing diguanylate cyclase [Gaiellales bacterium]|jgi:diguanylate cyclase (GGDEF)-like protein|nr:sensor domain-containing diguanylate cyclase [Gaiellales bacterium]